LVEARIDSIPRLLKVANKNDNNIRTIITNDYDFDDFKDAIDRIATASNTKEDAPLLQEAVSPILTPVKFDKSPIANVVHTLNGGKVW
jgi:hypothetical protein